MGKESRVVPELTFRGQVKEINATDSLKKLRFLVTYVFPVPLSSARSFFRVSSIATAISLV